MIPGGYLDEMPSNKLVTWRSGYIIAAFMASGAARSVLTWSAGSTVHYSEYDDQNSSRHRLIAKRKWVLGCSHLSLPFGGKSLIYMQAFPQQY